VLGKAPPAAHRRHVASRGTFEWDSEPPGFHLNNFHVRPEAERYIRDSFTCLSS